MSGREPTARQPSEEDEVDELLEDLEELEETAESDEERAVLQKTRATLNSRLNRRLFGLDDLAQQIVGGFILSAPFVVTEEVWSLAAGMSWLQWGIVVSMVFAIGYGTLYSADRTRDVESEQSIGWLPLRFVSLILTAYLSVSILAFVLSAPTTFAATQATTLKAISVGAIFSVVGAATADSVF